jgi:FimV-like protein
MLMMALAMPGAAQAIGLGDIHVDSALNERLVAQIEIIGASDLELSDLRAAVANRDTFARYGADRPSFLSSATFRVVRDGRGRAVLAVHSTDSFTEPLVNLLVDLRWHGGELIRQYTLLLDPPGFGSADRAADIDGSLDSARSVAADRAEADRVTNTVSGPAAPPTPNVPAVPPVAAPIAETKVQTVARRVDPPTDQPERTGTPRAARKTTHVKVGAKATLRGIAWRVGERSESDLQRMMIAIFRANPTAFDGNINRLRRGAVLTIPSQTEVAAISRAEAKSEVHAQMAAWHSPMRAAATNAMPAAPAPAAPAAPASGAQSSAQSDAPDTEALGRKVRSLEQELSEMKGVLVSKDDQLLRMQEQAARAEKPGAIAEATHAAAAPAVATPAAVAPVVATPPVAAPAAVAPVVATPPVAAPAAVAPVVAAPPVALPAAAAPEAQAKSHPVVFAAIAAGLGIGAAALAALYFRIRRRAPAPKNSSERLEGAPNELPNELSEALNDAHEMPIDSHGDVEATAAGDGMTGAAPAAEPAPSQDPAPATGPERMQEGTQEHGQDQAYNDIQAHLEAIAAAYADDDTYPLLPIVGTPQPAERSEITGGTPAAAPEAPTAPQALAAPQDASAAPHGDTVNHKMEPTRLDYNLVDLDQTVQHVQMPSALNEHVVVKERRTNLADVLKLAIEREPDRHDLRMKLLELYYAAASTNRKGFLEVVQQFARDHDFRQSGQWDKIAFMGRQIAPENPLFTESSAADDDLANCA